MHFCFLTLLLVTQQPEAVEWPGQWPCYRRDRFLTGFAPGKGAISAPRITWRRFLGGWESRIVVRGAAAGSTHELAVTDALVSRRLGEEWRAPQRLHDLLGNGSQYFIALLGKTIEVRDVAGKAVWRQTFAHPISTALVGEFVPWEKGQQLVLWGTKMRDRVVYNGGHCFSFGRGFDKARKVWEVEVGRNPQRPMMHKADMDGDGDDEIVEVTWYRAIVFDGATGKIQMECNNALNRNYGYTRVQNVDADPYPEIVILCDFKLHVDFIDNDGTKLFKPWDGQYPHAAAARDEILRVPHDPVADVDGDGDLEMVYNLFNIPKDGRWRVIVRDVRTGKVEIEEVGRYCQDVLDLDGDGVPELLCERVPLRHRVRYSELEIARIARGVYVPLHRIARGRWMRRQHALPGNSSSIAEESRLRVVRSDVDHDGKPEVLLSTDKDGDWQAEEMVAVGVDASGELRPKWRLRSPGPTRVSVENARGGDVLVRFTHGPGKVTSHGASGDLISRRVSGRLYSFPIAANLDGRPGAEIIVQNSREQIEAIAAPTKQEEAGRRLWAVPGLGEPYQMGYRGEWRGPIAVDLEGDGRPEVLCQDRTPNGACRLVVLNADGTVRWARIFEDFPYSRDLSRLDRFHAGRFNDDAVLDIYLSLHNSGKSSGQSMTLDGRRGRTLWHRKTVADLYPPDQRGKLQGKSSRGCFATKGIVVHDFNSDGFDDLLFLALDYICLINGRSGMALRPTPFLHSVIRTSWCAYSSPVTVDADRDGVLEIFASASFGTVAALTLDWKPLWSVPSSYQTNPRSRESAVADYDGDGRLEAIVLDYRGDLIQYDVKTGAEDWRSRFAASYIGDIAAADVDGDGLPEAVFCRGNDLVAIGQSKPHIIWSLALPARGGPPIIADVDGDGLLEIVVCTADGYVNVVE